MTKVALVLLAAVLMPVVGWTVAATTGRRPPRVTLAAVLVPTLVWTMAVWPPDPVLTALSVPLLAWGTALAFTDLTRYRLPDVLVLTAYPPAGAILILAAITTGRPDDLLRAGLAAAVALSLHGLAAATGAIGFGDAKLAGLLALFLGWLSWSAVAAAGLLALVAAVVPALWAWRSRGRGARFALGPSLLLAALTAPAVT